MPKISVITPVYNCEDFIESSITSVLNQSIKDFEFIIINDGSTDLTHEIISKFTDERIRYINHSDNLGVMLRSKEAISLATGEFIAISDADDVNFLNRFETQCDFLETHPDVFCVGSHAKKIDVKGNFIGDWTFPKFDHKLIVSMLVIEKKCPIINPTAFFRLKGYQEIGGYSPKEPHFGAHDLDFWCRAILAGKKLANIQEILLKYRVNPSGMTRKNKLMQFADYNEIMRNFMQRIKDVKF